MVPVELDLLETELEIVRVLEDRPARLRGQVQQGILVVFDLVQLIVLLLIEAKKAEAERSKTRATRPHRPPSSAAGPK